MKSIKNTDNNNQNQLFQNSGNVPWIVQEKWLNLGKNSKLCGVLTYFIPYPLSLDLS